MPTPRLAWFLLTLTGCGEAAPPAPPAAPSPTAAPAAAMGAITGANVVWGDALVRGDSAALAGLYADSAVLMRADGDLRGRDAIVSALLAGRRVGRDTLHATATVTDQLDVAGDRAYEAGTLTWTLASPARGTRQVVVRYVSFWQQAAGRWQLVRSLRPLP